MSTTLSKQEQGDVGTAERTRGGKTYTPRIDIGETSEALILYVDLPGVAAEDLDIRFENRELTIHGKVPERHGDRRYVYGEYGIGDYYRTFTIGEEIDAQRISAELRDGVLTLRLPKVEAIKPRRIAVNGN